MLRPTTERNIIKAIESNAYAGLSGDMEHCRNMSNVLRQRYFEDIGFELEKDMIGYQEPVEIEEKKEDSMSFILSPRFIKK